MAEHHSFVVSHGHLCGKEKSRFLSLGQKGVFVPSFYDLLQDELVWDVCKSGPLPEVLESGMKRVGSAFLPSIVSSVRS